MVALIRSAVVWSSEVTVLHKDIKQLQDGNKKLNKDLKDAQTAKLQRQEQARIESANAGAVQRVRSSGNCEQYRPIFSQYPWNVEIALAVCVAESGGRAGPPESPTHDRGLMQINWVHANMVGGNLDALYDPATNVSIAYQIYSASGWYPWSTCTNGVVKCW